MKCENKKCGKEHNGSFATGRFCSRACSNSFSTSNDTNDSFKEAICPKCNKIHYIKKRSTPKLSPCTDCGGKSFRNSDKRRMGVCICCGSKLHRGLLFCSNDCNFEYNYLIWLNKWKLNMHNGMKGKDSVSVRIRIYLYRKYNNCCQKCGWNKVHPITDKIPLTVHHIDGDYTNNKEDNLELLCPNCHSLTSTYGSLNKNSPKKRKNSYR